MKDEQDPGKTPKTGKRLLFIAYCFPPNAEAGTHRSFRFVKHLIKLGWEVVVLTAAPEDYLPGTPVDTLGLKGLPSDLEIIRTPVLRGLSGIIRLRNTLSRSVSRKREETETPVFSQEKSAQNPSQFQALKDLISSLFSIPDRHIGWLWGSLTKGHRAIKGRSFDVIYSSAPPWTSHLIAYALSKLIRAPWVADFRDPWARNPWKSDRTKIQKFMAELLEKSVIKDARFTILNTDWAREEYLGFYKNTEAEKFQLIPNGYDPEDFEEVRKASSSGTNTFNLVHAGSLYGGRDPAPLLKAWALFIQGLPPNKNCLLLSLVGVGGQQKDELKKIVSRWGLDDHVDLVPRVSHREALDIMASADLLLILQGGTSLCVPAKLFEYMALSKPILGLAPEGATADILALYPIGKVVDPDDPEKILAGLQSFFDERKSVFPNKALRQFIDRYKAFHLAKELSQLLDRSMIETKC